MTRAARPNPEAGFTLVEILIGMVVLTIGIFALVASFDHSRGLANVSEHETAAAQVAERELETLLTVPYNSLVLAQDPPATATAGDAGRWNSIGPTVVPRPNGGTCTAFNSDSATANDEWSCRVAAATTPTSPQCPTATLGTVALTWCSNIQDDRGNRFRVYRYITWVNDTSCTPASTCRNPPTANGDYKRVTVAVQLITLGGDAVPTRTIAGPLRPITVSAVRANPTMGANNKEGNPSPCTLVQC